MMSSQIQLPDGFRWQEWIERWDKMQERYIARRSERIELLIRLVGAARYPVSQVLDLGCGTGSLMQRKALVVMAVEPSWRWILGRGIGRIRVGHHRSLNHSRQGMPCTRQD